MNRWICKILIVLISVTLITSCSDKDSNPVVPMDGPNAESSVSQAGTGYTQLWGYYDVAIDIESQTVDVSVDRSAMFAANVVTFLNGNPANLMFKINETPIGPDYIDVDIDVTITHPFKNLPQYDGYDVRGVFIADGSSSMTYGNNLSYATSVEEAVLLNADGYTRWFNPTEFTAPGLFGYKPGALATPGFTGTATLNPYKYFADGLAATEDVFTFLEGTEDDGFFATGSSNTRRYLIRFPKGKPIAYSYAVVANWKGETSYDHPANCPESPAITVAITDNVYYTSSQDNGGKLKLDVDIFSWGVPMSTIIVESNVLSGPAYLDPVSVLTGASGNVSSFYVELVADNVQGTEGNEYWIILEYDDDYDSGYGAPYPEGEALASFFRYDLYTSDAKYNSPPDCVLEVDGPTVYDEWDAVEITFDATGSSDPDDDDYILVYEWDFNGNGVYNEDPEDNYTGPMENPTHTYIESFVGDVNLRLWDTNSEYSECSIGLDLTINGCWPEPVLPSTATYTYVYRSYMHQTGAEPTRADTVNRVISDKYIYQSPEGYRHRFYAFTVDDGGSTALGGVPIHPYGNYTPYSIAVGSDDTIYYYDSSSSWRVWTAKWDSNALTFTDVHQPFGVEIPHSQPRYLHRLTIDENDNPIALCRSGNSTQMYIYHWDSSSGNWGSAISVPSSIVSSNGNYSYIDDIEYNPEFGHYILTDRYYEPGMYVIDSSGDIVHQDEDVFGSLIPDGVHYYGGLYIDKDQHECRVLYIAGNYNSGYQSYMARYNHGYGQKLTSTISGSPSTGITPRDGRGCVVESNASPGTYYYMGQGYSYYISRVEIPDW